MKTQLKSLMLSIKSNKRIKTCILEVGMQPYILLKRFVISETGGH